MFMKHLAEVDKNGTVLMIQLENECGHLGTDRDYCEAANELFHSAVPEELTKYLTDNRSNLSPYLQQHLTSGPIS